MGCDRKSETHVHTTRVTLDGRIEELLHLCESDDPIEFLSDFSAAHAKDGAIQGNILPASEFGVETGSDLEQTRDPTLDLNTSGAWLCNSGKYLQQCRFPGTV